MLLEDKNEQCKLCCTKIKNFGVVKGNNVILENINIHIHCGELTAIIGPNGAGKSTLLKAIIGDVKHSGELDYISENEKKINHPIIGYVPQHLNFDIGSPLSVLDLFMSTKYKRPVWLMHPKKVKLEVKEGLKRVHAEHLIDRRLGNLSGGELQRVLLALALEPLPNILLLDEPVSGVDQKGLGIFYDMVCDLRHEYDLSIILVSHDIPLVTKHADRVIFLNKTVICSGTAQEVFENSEFLNTFGLKLQDLTYKKEEEPTHASMV